MILSPPGHVNRLHDSSNHLNARHSGPVGLFGNFKLGFPASLQNPDRCVQYSNEFTIQLPDTLVQYSDAK